MPRVGVVVLNWNGWRDTVECLRSLKQLDYPNLFLVVVDNGSTDDSVYHLTKAIPGIRILGTGTNLGFAGGNNVGIHYAVRHGADYVWLLNNDTTADPTALSHMVSVAEADGRIGAVGSVLYSMERPTRVQMWGGGRLVVWMGIARAFSEPVPAHRLDYVTGASVLLRQTALEDVGFLDERFFMYWEDADLGLRLRRARWTLQVAPDAKVWHRQWGSVGAKSESLERYFDTSAMLFVGKHARFPKVSMFVSAAGRVAKRIMKGDIGAARTVLATLRDAMGREALQ